MKTTFGIGIAGMCGALLRVAIGQMMGEGSHFPFATFIINVSASFLLCLCVAIFGQQKLVSTSFYKAITIGFLGSFSTFSAFSMETVRLFEHGKPGIAFIYIFSSLLAGLLVAFLGDLVGRKLVTR